jgi:hypothetical protein
MTQAPITAHLKGKIHDYCQTHCPAREHTDGIRDGLVQRHHRGGYRSSLRLRQTPVVYTQVRERGQAVNAVKNDPKMTVTNFAKTTVELRAIADTKVAEWRELVAAHKIADNEARAYYAQHAAVFEMYRGATARTESHLYALTLDLAAAEANAKRAVAEREAALALDAAESAEGDALTRTRDLSLHRDALADAVRVVEAAKAALATAEQRVHDTTHGRHRAENKLAARRAANDLPFVPRQLSPGWAPGRKTLLDMVDEAIDAGLRPLPQLAQVESARNQVTELAARLEADRLEKAEEERVRENGRVLKAREDSARSQQERDREAHERRDLEAKEQRKASLAKAYLARLQQKTAGGVR